MPAFPWIFAKKSFVCLKQGPCFFPLIMFTFIVNMKWWNKPVPLLALLAQVQGDGMCGSLETDLVIMVVYLANYTQKK